MTAPNRDQWWRDAVIYQIYPRSWADSNGDGIGDLPGITARLPHLADLGVDAVWLSPFYTSPQKDAGYDVADYRDVDPLFGTLADIDALIARGHELGLRVLVDVVPNHSSDQHPWFQAALAAGPGSRERARYLFRPGKGRFGDKPPNNWPSLFGGPAWDRVTEADGTPGEWYLHLFDSSQPDFDWTNPEVADEMADVLRFWLERGVDGFRVDVAHGLAKKPGLPDLEEGSVEMLSATANAPMWDQPAVHDIYRRWRTLTDSYSPPGRDEDKMMCAEAWVVPATALAKYVRSDEMHQCFNFGILTAPWRASDLREVISDSMDAVAEVGAPPTWVLSNHDVVRHATRLGYPPAEGPERMFGIGADDPQPDVALGLRRARAAVALTLALPGSAYLYQGEELGLPDATRLPDEARQDPTWERSGHVIRGRDGCRVPIPWEADRPAFGFGPSEDTWLPQPPEYADYAVDRQRGVEGSTLELYRTLLRLRKDHRLGRRTLTWLEVGEDVVGFELAAEGDRTVRVLTNLSAEPVILPADAEVLVRTRHEDGPLAPDETVWLRLR